MMKLMMPVMKRYSSLAGYGINLGGVKQRLRQKIAYDGLTAIVNMFNNILFFRLKRTINCVFYLEIFYYSISALKEKKGTFL